MSRRRPYLNLRQSITNLFRTTARWLHDTVDKESRFEKPYIDRDYRAMHLDIPNPDWPSTPIGDGFFPDEKGKWTFKFDPGICTLGVLSLACGEEGNLGVSIGLLPPSSLKTQVLGIAWEAKSSNPNVVEIVGVDNGISGTIHLKASDESSGTATICVRGTLQGQAIQELVVPFDRKGVLKYQEAATIPAMSRKYYQGYAYDCGCIDIDVDCVCLGAVWDTGTSAETVAPSSSAVVAVIDSTNTTKTWTVSGVGFWLNAGHTVTSISTSANSVTIHTDATACGTATITACGATGYIRSTAGGWTANVGNCVTSLGGLSGPADFLTGIVQGPYRYRETRLCAGPGSPGCDDAISFSCTGESGEFGASPNGLADCVAQENCAAGRLKVTGGWDIDRWDC